MTLRNTILLCWALAATLGGPAALPAAAQAAGAPATTIPSDQNAQAHANWFDECRDRVAAMQGKPVDIIFIGDSITQNWVEMPSGGWNEVGGTVWPQWYAGRNALDFGVGADRTQDVLWRLDTMDVKAFRPKVAVVLIGTNNTGDTPADIAAGVGAVVNKARQTFPGVKVILMSILPTTREHDRMMAADALIKPLADGKHVFYFDLASLMTPVGDNWKGIGADHLHLTPVGYELWATAMEPLLDRLLGVPPPTVPNAPPVGATVKVACVGDSITAGVGASDGGHNYPSLLATLLGPQYQVGNFGESGATLLKHGDSPYWQRGGYGASAAFAPNEVVVMLGANDSKPQNWGAHADEFAADYAALLDYYAALPTHPKLFVCLPTPVAKANYGINEPVVEAQIPLIRRIAAQKGATVIDVHGQVPNDPADFVDGVHPNDAGYTFLAGAVYQGLTQAPLILPLGGGTFGGTTTVTIRQPTPDAQVRYTGDGTFPTPHAPLYQRPLILTGTRTIRAQAFRGGRPLGQINTAVFTLKP